MIMDQPYEVRKEVLDVLRANASGCFMWRESGGKYFIKLVPTGQENIRKEIAKLL